MFVSDRALFAEMNRAEHLSSPAAASLRAGLTPLASRLCAGRRTTLMGLDEPRIVALRFGERLPCRDRLERPGGRQREIALERLARLGVLTGQGERRHKQRMRRLDVVRIDRNRPAILFNRLVIILQPEIGRHPTGIETGEKRFVRPPLRSTRLYLRLRLSYCTSIVHLTKEAFMPTTRVFKNGNSQAVRIPAELAYERNDIDVEIERVGDELRIRPARRSLAGVLDKFARFSPDFMANGRGGHEQAPRDAL